MKFSKKIIQANFGVCDGFLAVNSIGSDSIEKLGAALLKMPLLEHLDLKCSLPCRAFDVASDVMSFVQFMIGKRLSIAILQCNGRLRFEQLKL